MLFMQALKPPICADFSVSHVLTIRFRFYRRKESSLKNHASLDSSKYLGY